MEDHESATGSVQSEAVSGSQTNLGAPSGTTAAGVWKVIWPLVAGGLVIGGGTLLSKRLGEGDQPPQPSHLATPPPSSPTAEAPRPESAPAPRSEEVDPYEDALRPEGTGEFFRYCRDMDEVMNLEGVEALAKKRLQRVPDSYTAWAVMGYIAESRHDLEAARRAYQNAKHYLDQDKLMARQPLQVRLEQEMMTTGRMGLYLFCGNDQDAQFASHKQAVRDRPNEAHLWLLLGVAAASRQNLAVMARCADELERLDPAKARQFEENYINPMKARLEMLQRRGAR